MSESKMFQAPLKKFLYLPGERRGRMGVRFGRVGGWVGGGGARGEWENG
jgi:hypothetical protein